MDEGSLQNIDIHEGLESTITILNHRIKNERIEIIREYAPDLPHIIGYGSELNQVWTNLISNAIDAINGQGQIWLKTYKSNDRIVVEISDNGPGIPPNIQSRIFDPFFTTKDVGKGTGLGLSITYRIITEMHKGDINFTSKPGNTMFKVSLPIKKY